jgi:molybdopterin molybdotransferase
MAQLSQDCFASGAKILTVDEAVAAITARFTPVAELELVGLHDADGRVLADDVVATLALPPFTNSAVDGFAVRGEDLPARSPQLFRVTRRLQAGSTAAGPPLAPGEAARIFTGAPMPEGADTVFMQEDVRVDEAGRALLPAGLQRGANVRPAGEDIAAGRVLVPANRWLRPQDVAAIAAMGLTQVRVRRRVKVAVFSNGDEIAEPAC